VNDVDDVVDGNGADEPMALVHHRDSHEVVLRHHPRDLLLIRLGRHADDVLVPDRGHRGRRIGDEQTAQRNHAHQVLMVVHDVELEVSLGGDRVADVLDRLLHADVGADGHEVR